VADALLLLQLPGPVLVPDQVARVPRVGESGDLQGALGRQVLAGPVGLLVPGIHVHGLLVVEEGLVDVPGLAVERPEALQRGHVPGVDLRHGLESDDGRSLVARGLGRPPETQVHLDVLGVVGEVSLARRHHALVLAEHPADLHADDGGKAGEQRRDLRGVVPLPLPDLELPELAPGLGMVRLDPQRLLEDLDGVVEVAAARRLPRSLDHVRDGHSAPRCGGNRVL
jgi:hypothetical protein